MEKILERFLRYVAVDTKSDPCSESQPSAAKELDLLQQILFYRERGFALETIRVIIYREDFDLLAALEDHLQDLQAQGEPWDAAALPA